MTQAKGITTAEMHLQGIKLVGNFGKICLLIASDSSNTSVSMLPSFEFYLLFYLLNMELAPNREIHIYNMDLVFEDIVLSSSRKYDQIKKTCIT